MNVSGRLLLICTLALGLAHWTAPARAGAEQPIRALLVIGGCCHDYAKQKDILARGVSARADVQWTIAYDPDRTTSHLNPVYDNPDWFKGFDVIVHDECSSGVNDLQNVERILEPHKHGLPAVNLHCAMHCYRTAPYPQTTQWMAFTGMNTNHHGPQLPIAITFTEKDNPIVRGMKDWTTIREELYHQESLLPTAHALATGSQNSARYKDDDVVIWTNDYHGARLFSTTLGHNNETCADPRYLDLVTRGLLWSVGKLDDKHFRPVSGGSEKRS